MTHTPGPWRVLIGLDYTRVVMDKTETRLLMADLSGESDPRELAANARLIAAAPELLDMLTRAIDALMAAECISTYGGWSSIHEAKALIARIEQEVCDDHP
jgi:hypothetical protein